MGNTVSAVNFSDKFALATKEAIRAYRNKDPSLLRKISRAETLFEQAIIGLKIESDLYEYNAIPVVELVDIDTVEAICDFLIKSSMDTVEHSLLISYSIIRSLRQRANKF